MGILLLHFQQSKSGLPNLNVLVAPWKTMHVKDVEKSVTTPETVEKAHNVVLDDVYNNILLNWIYLNKLSTGIDFIVVTK